MALIKEVTPYRAECRCKPDGSTAWCFQFRQRILEDGVLIPGTDTEGPALTAIQAQSLGFPLAKVLGAELAKALIDLDACRADVKAAQAERDELAEAVERLAAEAAAREKA